MIVTLEIDKIHAGQYRVAVTSSGAEVTEPGFHSSIEDAIREEALAVPEGFAHFVEVRYGGISSGTMLLRDAPVLARETANRIVGLLAEMHRLAEV